MRYLNWLNFAIGTLIIILGAHIILAHVEAYFSVLPSEKLFISPGQEEGKTEPESSNENLDIIVERNLFQVETGYPAREPDMDPQEADLEFQDARIASIGLTLLGTVFSKTGNSKAIIMDETSKSGNYYSMGDAVDGYVIVAIRRKKAVVEKNNEKFLLLQAKGLSEPDEIEGEEGIRIVSRDQLKDQMQNFSDVFRNIGVVPYMDNGKITGVKITYIRKGTFVSTLGLQKNDIIKSVDGRKIRNVQEGMQLYDSLTKRDRVRLEITRDGQTFFQDFRIK